MSMFKGSRDIILAATCAALSLLTNGGCSRQTADKNGDQAPKHMEAGEGGAAHPRGDTSSGPNPPATDTNAASGARTMSAPGIPEGYDAFEQADLHTGDWRFYRIVEREDSSSVHEANLPVRAGQPKPGADGLAEFLADPAIVGNLNAADPARLATQVAMFLVQGDSRQSCLFRVIQVPAQDAPGFEAHFAALHPPQVELDGEQLTVRAWLRRDGYLRRMIVIRKPGEPLIIDMKQILTR